VLHNATCLASAATLDASAGSAVNCHDQPQHLFSHTRQHGKRDEPAPAHGVAARIWGGPFAAARVAATMTDRLKRLRAVVTVGITTSQEAGSIRTDVSADTLAAIVIAVSDGLTMQHDRPARTFASGGHRGDHLEILMAVPPIQPR
jgi:hypothetical protein